MLTYHGGNSRWKLIVASVAIGDHTRREYVLTDMECAWFRPVISKVTEGRTEVYYVDGVVCQSEEDAYSEAVLLGCHSLSVSIKDIKPKG